MVVNAVVRLKAPALRRRQQVSGAPFTARLLWPLRQ